MPKHNRLRALIVDEYPDAAASLAQLMTLYGFDARTAPSVTEGMRTMVDFTPDMVLFDINLPDGSGYDLVREIRRQLAREPLFIAMTRYSGMEEHSLREGIEHHFIKTTDPCVIERLVKQYAANVANQRSTLHN